MISFLLERGKTREITVGEEGAGMLGPAYDALDEVKQFRLRWHRGGPPPVRLGGPKAAAGEFHGGNVPASLEGHMAALRRALHERNAALRAKDVLIREIDHRVRNSLQLIATMIHLQAGRHGDPSMRRELFAACGRVEAVAEVHSMLLAANGSERIRVDHYLRSICTALRKAFDVDGRYRCLELDTDPSKFPANKAIPLGLVVNELVTNAFRHAFAEGAPGTVRVRFRRGSDGLCTLTVTDNGRGLPKIDPSRQTGLGLQVVAVMASQLGACLSSTSQFETMLRRCAGV
jgi:chemotaxis family two-component system sensor kinase Cph1